MRTIVTAAAAVVVLGFLSGCVPVGCATARHDPPHVTVDATAWFAKHSDSSIRVCFAGGCETWTNETPLSVYPSPSGGLSAPGRTHELTVVITALGHTVVRRAQVALVLTAGPLSLCGPVPSWSRLVAIDENTHLHVLGPGSVRP